VTPTPAPHPSNRPGDAPNRPLLEYGCCVRCGELFPNQTGVCPGPCPPVSLPSPEYDAIMRHLETWKREWAEYDAIHGIAT
jgi:hypothetical protein